MKLNGWQRLFVVFAAVCVGLYAAAWASSYPELRYANSVYSCKLRESEVSSERATAYIQSGLIPRKDNYMYPEVEVMVVGECLTDLREVAAGTKHEKNVAEWRRQAISYSKWLFLFLGIVYGLGWCLGWIWRGFFPKKS